MVVYLKKADKDFLIDHITTFINDMGRTIPKSNVNSVINDISSYKDLGQGKADRKVVVFRRGDFSSQECFDSVNNLVVQLDMPSSQSWDFSQKLSDDMKDNDLLTMSLILKNTREWNIINNDPQDEDMLVLHSEYSYYLGATSPLLKATVVSRHTINMYPQTYKVVKDAEERALIVEAAKESLTKYEQKIINKMKKNREKAAK